MNSEASETQESQTHGTLIPWNSNPKESQSLDPQKHPGIILRTPKNSRGFSLGSPEGTFPGISPKRDEGNIPGEYSWHPRGESHENIPGTFLELWKISRNIPQEKQTILRSIPGTFKGKFPGKPRGGTQQGIIPGTFPGGSNWEKSAGISLRKGNQPGTALWEQS